MSRAAPIAAGLVLLCLAGCVSASVPWRHPTLPREQWGQDYSSCRRQAERDTGWREDDNASASPFREYDRQRAKRQADGSLALCMTDLGYVPASRGDQPERR
jgi:hypothetical protein